MNKSITVVALGPGSHEYLTLQSAQALKKAKHLILRTGRHDVANWLTEQNIPFETLDSYYDEYWDFDEMHQAMAEDLWTRAASNPLTFAVMDPSTDGAVNALYAQQPSDGVIKCLCGITSADYSLSQLPADMRKSSGVRIIPAMDIISSVPDASINLLVTEIDNPALAGDVKIALTDLYRDEMEVILTSQVGKPKRIMLCELDRQKHYDHTTCIFIPSCKLKDRNRYTFQDLCDIMEILRAPGGCPWDQEQTHQTLRKYLLQEAYEACGAIDENDPDHLADELGDVLLQIVFNASIGKSHGTFTISDVTSNICNKMIYRHAHVFGDTSCQTAEDVSNSWEKLKKVEKGLKLQGEVLEDVSKALPALTRASKVQKKAAHVGFDWNTALQALPKVFEEANEVKQQLDEKRDPGMEIGDLLFAAVNVARLAEKDPQDLLQCATEKFIRRFTAMEKLIIMDGKRLEDLTLDEMDVYWKRVKSAE